MIEIRIGQIWQEKKYNQRVMRVDELIHAKDWHGRSHVSAARLKMVRGKGRPETTVQAYILRSDWTLIEEAPSAPRRRIALPISQATESHCGLDLARKCPLLKLGEEYPYCEAFGVNLDYDPKNPDAAPARLPACIAAEVK